MYDEILFPIDGGEEGYEAAGYAYDEAESHDATLNVLHVIDEKESTAIVGQGWEKNAQLTEESRGITGKIATDADEHGVDVVEETRRGAPASEILTTSRAKRSIPS